MLQHVLFCHPGQLSHHTACTVWWSFLAAVVIIATASICKLEHAGWLTYVGFLSSTSLFSLLWWA
jgi:hypothetical protein